MNEDALRALVRETLARLESQAARPTPACRAAAADFAGHSSHHRYALPRAAVRASSSRRRRAITVATAIARPLTHGHRSAARPADPAHSFLRPYASFSRSARSTSIRRAPFLTSELMLTRRRQRGFAVSPDRPGRRGSHGRRADAGDRGEHRGRLRQHRRGGGEGAWHCRDEHAGRADRGHGGVHVGADPRRRAARCRRRSGGSHAACGRAGPSISCWGTELRGKQLGIIGARTHWPRSGRQGARLRHARRLRAPVSQAAGLKTCRSTNCW